MCEKEPAEGAFLYLLGRIQPTHAQARNYYRQALDAPRPCAFAHIGLCSLELASANYEATLEHCQLAEKNNISAETTREAKEAALLALHRYDDLLKDIRQRRKLAPQDIELAAEEIRISLLKDPKPEEATSLIDRFCKTGLGQWKETDKPKARAYLEGIAACALGDEKTFAQKITVFSGEFMRFQAAICERNLTSASDCIAPDSGSDYQLLLYLLAATSGDSEASARTWSVAETALRKEYSREPELSAFLENQNAATATEVCQLQSMPNRKRILLAALGQRFPQYRAVLYANAAKLNNYPDYIRGLIRSITDKPGAR